MVEVAGDDFLLYPAMCSCWFKREIGSGVLHFKSSKYLLTS